MTAKKGAKSQVVELLLHVAELLDVKTDRELAELAGVVVDNIDNWKSGASQELKAQTLQTIKDGLAARVHALKERARVVDAGHESGLVALEIEEESGPAALQRQFHDRVTYDYLGHRFLYFEPQGALAWESLMKGGYDQSCWLAGVDACARAFFDEDKGPIARALGLGRRGARGLDVVSLGPGEASKEAVVVRHLAGGALAWLSVALVDVSIPLVLKGAKACRAEDKSASVLPFCADFEEGKLTFLHRLRPDGVRVVLMLGNVFGNVRDEEVLVKERLARLLRPGDFLWLEVATRAERLEDDPLYAMTKNPEGELTAPEANRRLLLEGPFRRWEAATGRRPSDIFTRVWLREDDETSRVPRSLNFCHDLVFRGERRACTMLYSRRYDVAALSRWLEQQGFAVESTVPVDDSQKRTRVAHVLARKRA